MRYKILKTAFLIWIALWLFFIVRELFIKGALSDYGILLSRSLEGKRSYVTGDRFYEFLTFCNKNLPQSASYGWLGVEEYSHAKRRATYYLYPHLEKDNAEFILVYDRPHKTEKGYEIYVKLDEARFILKRK